MHFSMNYVWAFVPLALAAVMFWISRRRDRSELASTVDILADRVVGVRLRHREYPVSVRVWTEICAIAHERKWDFNDFRAAIIKTFRFPKDIAHNELAILIHLLDQEEKTFNDQLKKNYPLLFLSDSQQDIPPSIVPPPSPTPPPPSSPPPSPKPDGISSPPATPSPPG